jgi:hypothetical protein
MTRAVPGWSAGLPSDQQPDTDNGPPPWRQGGEPGRPAPADGARSPQPTQPEHRPGPGSQPTQPDHPPGPGSPPTPRRRRWPDPGLGAIIAVGVGLLLVWLHHPRMGLYFIAAVLAGLAGLRLLLPARTAGLLVVRGRSFDVAVLGLLAVGMFVIASVTHFPKPGP